MAAASRESRDDSEPKRRKVCDAMVAMSTELKVRARQYQAKLVGPAEALILQGKTLRQVAEQLTTEGWKPFRTDYANGAHHGGDTITQSYVTRLLENFPQLKAVWQTEVDRRAAAALAKKSAERIRQEARGDARHGPRSGLQSAISVRQRRVKVEQRREAAAEFAEVAEMAKANAGTAEEPVNLS